MKFLIVDDELLIRKSLIRAFEIKGHTCDEADNGFVALQKLNPGKITLIRIHGGRHNNLPTFDEYHNFIRDILKE